MTCAFPCVMRVFQAGFPVGFVDGHLLRFSVLPLTWATPATLHQLYQIMAWSINALGVALAFSAGCFLLAQVVHSCRFC